MAKPFRFCLCADDYAMAPGVSRGILEALDAGALTATSVMTTSDWWPDHAPGLGAHRGRASIGLHLNLTLGRPLGPMPALAPTGMLPSIGTLLSGARRGTLPLDEIAAEIDRQLTRFVDIWGQPPDHVDGHQHVHVLAPIRPLLFAALRRRGWSPWIRDSGDRPDRILRRGRDLKKAIGLAVLASGFHDQAGASKFQTNEGFAGFSSFDVSEDYGKAFGRYLTCPGQRHLVMCHPGYVDDALRAQDPVVESRERELAFFLSPDFGALLNRAHATLGRFDIAATPESAAAV